VPLGETPVERIFLAGRLMYSRVSAVRWGTQMDLEIERLAHQAPISARAAMVAA
jgi:hypothetical protein